jgi:hypothetical protein
LLNCFEQPFRTVDLIELTISSSNHYVDNPKNNLSSLRLPTIFFQSYTSPKTLPDALSQNPIKSNKKMKFIDEESLTNNDMMTVSRYISNISQNTLIDSMFSWEIRYAKNVLQIMKYLAPKLSQPFLIYELDFEMTSFFRYIRWKMLNFYMKHTKRVRFLVERMFGVINLGVSRNNLKKKEIVFYLKITNYPGINATREQMWEGIQGSILTQVEDLLGFAKDVRKISLFYFLAIKFNKIIYLDTGS